MAIGPAAHVTQIRLHLFSRHCVSLAERFTHKGHLQSVHRHVDSSQTLSQLQCRVMAPRFLLHSAMRLAIDLTRLSGLGYAFDRRVRRDRKTLKESV